MDWTKRKGRNLALSALLVCVLLGMTGGCGSEDASEQTPPDYKTYCSDSLESDYLALKNQVERFEQDKRNGPVDNFQRLEWLDEAGKLKLQIETTALNYSGYNYCYLRTLEEYESFPYAFTRLRGQIERFIARY